MLHSEIIALKTLFKFFQYLQESDPESRQAKITQNYALSKTGQVLYNPSVHNT